LRVGPENVKLIAAKISTDATVESVAELGLVISLVYQKALTEPHYCETYADLVFFLKAETKDFASDDGGKPVTFKSALLNVVQNEFEAMPTTLAPTPEEIAKYDEFTLKENARKQKARLLANMRFIGNLFLRTLLTSKIIAGIIQEIECTH
jgi:translation initiation factor 4G